MRRAAVTVLLVVAACGGSPEESVDVDTSAVPTTTSPADDELFTPRDDTGTVVVGDDTAASTVPESVDAATSTVPESVDAATSTVPEAVDAATSTTTTLEATAGDEGSTADGTDVSADGGTVPTGGDGGDGGGGDGTLTAGDIDRSVLLDADELASLGLGDGWIVETFVEAAIENDGAPCGLSRLSTVDQLYALGTDADGSEFEQRLVPGLGPVGVTIVRDLPECDEITEQLGAGGVVEELRYADAESAAVFGIDDDEFTERFSWLAADVGGLLVLAFHIGEPGQRADVEAAFGRLVADVAAGV